jgi:hypothetical protein
MTKRVGILAMILAGGLAVLQPSVAQARDWDDFHRYDRHEDRRDWNRRERDRREDRREEWRDHERWERRDFRGGYGYGYRYYGQPNYYNNGYPNQYCPR